MVLAKAQSAFDPFNARLLSEADKAKKKSMAVLGLEKFCVEFKSVQQMLLQILIQATFQSDSHMAAVQCMFPSNGAGNKNIIEKALLLNERSEAKSQNGSSRQKGYNNSHNSITTVVIRIA